MNHNEKARIYDLFDRGEMTETAARELLGDAAFERAEEKTRGTEEMLSGDTGRFLTNP